MWGINWKNLNDPPDDFLRHQKLGIQFLRADSNSGDDAITEQILKLMRYDVTKLLDGNELNLSIWEDFSV